MQNGPELAASRRRAEWSENDVKLVQVVVRANDSVEHKRDVGERNRDARHEVILWTLFHHLRIHDDLTRRDHVVHAAGLAVEFELLTERTIDVRIGVTATTIAVVRACTACAGIRARIGATVALHSILSCLWNAAVGGLVARVTANVANVVVLSNASRISGTRANAIRRVAGGLARVREGAKLAIIATRTARGKLTVGCAATST